MIEAQKLVELISIKPERSSIADMLNTGNPRTSIWKSFGKAMLLTVMLLLVVGLGYYYWPKNHNSAIKSGNNITPIFNQLPVADYIRETVQKVYAGELNEQLIYRKRIRRKLKDYVKNVPPHIKAARAADEINEKLGKPLRYQNKGFIEYYITTSGPQAKEYLTANIDYQFYVERQLEAVADAILPFVDTSFAKAANASEAVSQAT